MARAEDTSNDTNVNAPPAADSHAASTAPTDATTTPAAVPDVKLSGGAAEVIKLAESGMSDDVLLAYIGNVKKTFQPGVRSNHLPERCRDFRRSGESHDPT